MGGAAQWAEPAGAAGQWEGLGGVAAGRVGGAEGKWAGLGAGAGRGLVVEVGGAIGRPRPPVGGAEMGRRAELPAVGGAAEVGSPPRPASEVGSGGVRGGVPIEPSSAPSPPPQRGRGPPGPIGAARSPTPW